MPMGKRQGSVKTSSVIPRPVLTLVVGIRIPFMLHKTYYWLKEERIPTSLRSSE